MIFNSKKVIFPRKGVSEKTRAIKKNNLIYIYIFKNLFFEQLNRSFNSPILCQLKISLFKLLSFSFPSSPLFFQNSSEHTSICRRQLATTQSYREPFMHTRVA